MACIPCDIALPDALHGVNFQDISGNGADMVPDALNVNAFATTGYLQTSNIVGGGGVIPVEKFPLNLYRESFIGSFVLNASAPGTAINVMGISASNTAGYTGIGINMQTTGALKFVPIINGVNSSVPAASTRIFAEATPRDIQVMIAWDAETMSLGMWKEGDLSDMYVGQMISTPFPDADLTHFVRFGGFCNTEFANNLLFRAIQFYKFTGGLPNSLGRIARALAANPDVPLNDSYFTFPRLKMLSGVIGQSGAAGPGGGATNLYYTSGNSADGCPCYDLQPVYNTGRPTYWPKLAGLMGKRGVWHQIMNTAFGSTALTETWIGMVRAWTLNMIVSPGAYVLDANGHIYQARSGSAVAGGGQACGPLGSTYTLNVTPSSGVGASGLSSWTDLGLASSLGAQYIAGYVCSTSDSLFDPNGRMAYTLAAVQNKPGYDVINVYICIGQGDKTVGATNAQYSKAIQQAAAYLTAQNIHVTVCMVETCDTVDAWYQAELMPGREAALTALASNYLVHRGVDFATTIGILPHETNAQPAAMLPYAALQNNGGGFIHFNAVGQMVQAEKMDEANQLIGW